ACAQGFTGQQSQGIHRLCEGQPSKHAVRLGRSGFREPSCLCAVECGYRDQRHTRSLSWGRSGDAGFDRLSDRLPIPRHADRDSPDPKQDGQGDRNPHARSLAEPAFSGLRARARVDQFRRLELVCLVLPQGTSAAIIDKLHAATLATINTPAVQTRMREIGADLVASERSSPDYLQKFVEAEIEKWAGPIKASGVSMD